MKCRALVLFAISCAALPCASNSEEAGDYREEVYAIDPELKIRIYEPARRAAGGKQPAIVFFFGGGWRNGNPGQFHEHCKVLSDHGFVSMAAEYRIQSKHRSTPFESFEDAKAAMRWARANADRLGIDPERLASGGGSAGGHLAAAVAVCDSNSATEVRDTPDAIVAFNPALNLKFPKIEEMWGPEVYARIESISPYHNLKKDHPPMIVFHGEGDTTVPFQTALDYVEKAKEIGVEPAPELVGYEGRPHGFFNFGRGDGRDYEDTVKRMVEFFRGLGWIEGESSR